MQLLKLHSSDDPIFEAWLSKKSNKYTSNNAQNEILKVMAHFKADEQVSILLHYE